MHRGYNYKRPSSLVWLLTTAWMFYCHANAVDPYLEIKRFTANNRTYYVDVENETTVTFFCEVKGHESTVVTLSVLQNGTEIPLKSDGLSEMFVSVNGDSYNSAHVTKTVFCRDTGKYVCNAANSWGDTHVTIMLAVRCPLIFLSIHGNNPGDVFPLYNTTDRLEIKIGYEGYPQPNQFFLKKLRSNSKQSDTLIYNDYTVGCQTPKGSPQGVVLLTMHNTNTTHWSSGQYVLVIENGFPTGLDFRFWLVAETRQECKDQVTTQPTKHGSTDAVTTRSDTCQTGVHVAIAVVCCIVTFVIAFVGGFYVGKKRATRKLQQSQPAPLHPAPSQESSVRYDHVTQRASTVNADYAKINTSSVTADDDNNDYDGKTVDNIHNNHDDDDNDQKPRRTNNKRQKLAVPENESENDGSCQQTFVKEMAGEGTGRGYVAGEGTGRGYEYEPGVEGVEDNSGHIYVDPMSTMGIDCTTEDIDPNQDGYE